MSATDQPRKHPTGDGDPTGEGDPTAPSLWEAVLGRLREAAAPRFEVEHLLGYGGMAGVYLAHEPKLGRRVAIKVMSPSLMLDPGLVKRFRQEARTIAQLDHPNIITVYDVAEDEDLHYFVMAYVPGRTVGHVMREMRGPLPVDVVRAWMYQIGSALDYAHRFGVVHRDVKPGNILLDAQGIALVTDFGIAKVADEEGLTRTGMLVGTPAYMSPEQCSSGEVGAASDQYSLGALCYQLLTGEPPFSGPTLAVLHAHVAQEPEPVKAIRPDCPDDVASTVDRMLAKRPADRWPSLGSAITAMGAAPLGHGDPLRRRLADLAAPVGRVTLSAPHGVRRPPVPSDDVPSGETFMAEAIVMDTEGRVLSGRKVTWQSEAPQVAAVLPDGRVVTLAPGTARVTGECGGVRDSLVFRVVDAPGGGEVAASPREIPAGNRIRLGELFPAGAPLSSGPDSGWGSTRPDVARITDDGDLQALRPGRALITAFQANRAVAAELTVTPAPGDAGATAGARAQTPVPVSAGAGARAGMGAAGADRTGSGTGAAGEGAARAGAEAEATRTTTGPTGAGEATPGEREGATGATSGPTRGRVLALAGGGVLAGVLLLGGGLLLFPGDRATPAGPSDAAGPSQPPVAGEPGADPGTAPGDVAVVEGDDEGDAPPAGAGGTDPATDPAGPATDPVGAVADPAGAAADPPAQALPDEAAPPGAGAGAAPPSPPEEGRVRIADLPPDARVVFIVAGREVRFDPDDEASLPPGSYEARITAPGFRPWEGRVTLEAGRTLDWRPTLEPEAGAADSPDAADAGAGEAARLEAEARAGIDRLLGEFARAFESRDMEQVLRFFLESPGAWADQWRPLIQDTRNASDLRAEVRELGAIELDGTDRGSAAFSVRIRYRDFRNTVQEPVLDFRAEMERRGGAWFFRTLSEGR
jgi:hypothetical protein